MPISLPYLGTYKNVPLLFEKIASAKIPEVFTQSFLETTIGLKGKNDRMMTPLLRNLGFLDQNNVPTTSYRLLKGDNAKAAIATGIRSAYVPLFDSDNAAHKLPPDKLKSLVAQVAGTDEATTSRIVGTFNALIKSADFETELQINNGRRTPDSNSDESDIAKSNDPQPKKETELFAKNPSLGNLRPEFHYNIQVHLPSNSSEETYLNIFNALRKTFQ